MWGGAPKGTQSCKWSIRYTVSDIYIFCTKFFMEIYCRVQKQTFLLLEFVFHYRLFLSAGQSWIISFKETLQSIRGYTVQSICVTTFRLSLDCGWRDHVQAVPGLWLALTADCYVQSLKGGISSGNKWEFFDGQSSLSRLKIYGYWSKMPFILTVCFSIIIKSLN